MTRRNRIGSGCQRPLFFANFDPPVKRRFRPVSAESPFESDGFSRRCSPLDHEHLAKNSTDLMVFPQIVNFFSRHPFDKICHFWKNALRLACQFVVPVSAEIRINSRLDARTVGNDVPENTNSTTDNTDGTDGCGGPWPTRRAGLKKISTTNRTNSTNQRQRIFLENRFAEAGAELVGSLKTGSPHILQSVVFFRWSRESTHMP